MASDSGRPTDPHQASPRSADLAGSVSVTHRIAVFLRTGPNGIEAAVLGFAALAAPALPILTAPPAFAVAFGVYTLVALIALGPQARPRSARPFGAANSVTLARAAAAALLAGIAADPAVADPTIMWAAVGLATLALVADGIDGVLARRAGRADSYGARFDMEVDALLMLALTLLLWSAGKAGAWIILLGGMRYAFLGAGYLWAALRRPLPPSRRRRAICAVQGIGLTVALVPAVQPHASAAIAAATFLLVAVSFAIDILWLRRAARGGS